MAEATRRKAYDMLAAEKMMLQGFHLPFLDWPISSGADPVIARFRFAEFNDLKASQPRTKATRRAALVRPTTGDRHDRILAPGRSRGRGRFGRCSAHDDICPCRGAAGRKTGAELLSLQGGRLRAHRHPRWCAAGQA